MVECQEEELNESESKDGVSHSALHLHPTLQCTLCTDATPFPPSSFPLPSSFPEAEETDDMDEDEEELEEEDEMDIVVKKAGKGRATPGLGLGHPY